MLKRFKELTVGNVWDKIIQLCLYASVFLVPILFLPWTVYQVAWNKQFFFVLLVFIAFIAWLIKSIVRGEIVYLKSKFNLVLAALLVVVVFSALFSGSRSLGFLGMTGAEVSSLLTMISLVMMFWLVGSVTMGSMRIAGLVLLVSSVLVLLLSILQMLGVWIFPWDFTKVVTFNTIGTNNAAALFFGFLFVITFTAAYLKSHFFVKVPRLVLIGLAVVSFLTALGMGFWAVFAGIGLTMAVIAVVDLLVRKEEAARSIIVPVVVLAICLFLVIGNFVPFLRLTFLPSFKLPAEVMPSFSASWNIVKATAKESWKNLALGSGPGTFQYQYGLYRSADLNNTDFWGVRFAYGLNALLTHIVDWGVLGILVWLAFLVLAVREAIKSLSRQPVLSLGLVYLVVSLFFYPQNIVIYFLIFFLTSLLVKSRASDNEEGYRKISLASTPTKTFSLSLLLMVLIMVATSVVFVQGQRYLGSIYFNSSLKTYNQTGDVEKTLPNIISGLDLDPRNDLYLQNLSQAYLLRLNNIINASQLPPAELQAQFSNNLGAAIQAAKRATEINPRDSQNWIALGRVYENVITLIPGAADLAVDAYTHAQALEPNNPVITTSLGRSHVLAGDFMARSNNKEGQQKEYELATLDLEKAVLQKPDYAPAHFMLVQVYDRQNKVGDAINRAENLKNIAPNDVGLLFQLGLLHYRANRYEKAKEVFEQAVQLFPNYSNARYFLGLIYDREGKPGKAMAEFQAVAELNPNNEDVKNIIRNLKSGRAALEAGQSAKAAAAAQVPVQESGGEVGRPGLKR